MSNTIPGKESPAVAGYMPRMDTGKKEIVEKDYETHDRVTLGAEKPEEDPGRLVLQYVCSKGDIEYHTVDGSFEGVREHENNHIQEYFEMAGRLGLKVINPETRVFTDYLSGINRQVAVGGLATCQFVAEIDGREVVVPVSKEGYILDGEIAKKLEQKKMGILKNDNSGIESREKPDKSVRDKEIKNPDTFLIFGE